MSESTLLNQCATPGGTMMTSPGPTCRLWPPWIAAPDVLGPTRMVWMTLSDGTGLGFYDFAGRQQHAGGDGGVGAGLDEDEGTREPVGPVAVEHQRLGRA